MKTVSRPASWVKYETSHPTISARVSLETKRKLLERLPTLGMTMADAFRVLAGEIEVKAIPVEEARKRGFEESKAIYGVPFPCNVCSKPVYIMDPEAKRLAGEYLTRLGWGHRACHERKAK